MVALARTPGPKRLPPECRPIASRRGPLTMTMRAAPPVLVAGPWSLKSGSPMAERAAPTTGKYSGRHPAITALMAACQAVTARARTGSWRRTSAAGHGPPASIRSTSGSVDGTTGRPSVQSRSKQASMACQGSSTSIPGRSRSRMPSVRRLRRELVAVGRRRDFESAHDSTEDAVITGGHRQLHQPGRAVFLVERVEGCLIDTVLLHELADVAHDLALLDRELGEIALGPDDVDGLVPHTGAAGRRHLGCPHVGALALAHGGQDGQAPVLAVDDAVRTPEVDHAQHLPGQLGAVQEHAEGPADLAEDLQHAVDHGLVLGGNVGLSGDGS